MSKSQVLRALVTQRLTAAAEDICALFERTIAEYEQEVLLLTHNNSSQQQRPSSQQASPEDTTGVPALEPLQPESEECHYQIVIVGNEEDDEESSGLHHREEANGVECGAGCSSEPLTQFHSDSEEHSDSSELTHRFRTRSYAPNTPDHRPFSCSDCGRSFTRKSDLKRHMLVHTGERPFRCPVCGKRFALKSNCAQHLKVIHHITNSEEEVKVRRPAFPFTCSDCGEKFRLQSRFREHMKSHREKKPFVCAVCEEPFHKKTNLTRHQTFIHHLCPVCTNRLGNRASLSEHLKLHVEEGTLDPNSVLLTEIDRPFTCSECGKSFKDRSNFSRHRLVHTEERRHKCPVCETRFKHKCHLTQHLVLCRQRSTNNGSVGEKPHVCPDCGKGFLHKCSLGTHRKIHTGERPFVCALCGEGFITKAYLTSHQKRSHPVCGVCKKRFTDETELRTHLRAHLQDVRSRGGDD